MKKLLYQQVYDQLKLAIQDGEIPVGNKLPAEKELMDQFDVSSITLKKALELLKKDGYISRRPRVGTFVISASPNSEQLETRMFDKPLFGCIITNFDDTFGTILLSGMLEHSNSKAHIVVKKSLGDIEREEEILQEFIEMNVAGILILPASSKFVSPTLLELASQKFPLVVIDRTLEGLPISSISSDNTEAGRIITEKLFELGHKHIGMITSTSPVSTLDSRVNGFIRGHASFHTAFHSDYVFREIESVMPNSTVSIQTDINKIALFLETHPEITALVATEYNIALLIKQACIKLNKRIPEDLSVVCFDHPDNFFDASAFRFTHIKQAQYKIGVKAVDMLLKQINQPDAFKKEMLPPLLVEGDSVKAHKKN
ncbi:GntR family transcriptional regulator [Listeria ivanovii]|uniref:GntR family transcriptional regulator n=1 Tax=Listeria ivanovii TaxID=1638 RepID=UPI000DAA324C|nr:GntR family transcriptional regulator [Listeria ivanovii]PZG35584.1 GntR family transcriptional regulator [Listeria ivanovii]PZG46330.1 GntR family transcriptional regulator [Listeria ivanovii]PZH13542.1 GntR family transcriptional regulator [Listeria ivanovii]